MFIAMERFRVGHGEEERFEAVWRNRETRLTDTPGFRSFHLLRGPPLDDHTLLASHTVWVSRDGFAAWTRSGAFRKAHRDAGEHTAHDLGDPEFEGFEVVESG